MDRVVTIEERAARIELVLSDCDGVLTDAGVYYSEEGEALKRFSIRDGMGVERLRNIGVDVGFVSGENTGPLIRRAEKLGISELHLGIKNKVEVVEAILETRGLMWNQLAFVGDDVNDVEVMRLAGLAGAPADATEFAREVAHFVTPSPGGHGAFRDVAELIVSAKEGS